METGNEAKTTGLTWEISLVFCKITKGSIEPKLGRKHWN